MATAAFHLAERQVPERRRLPANWRERSPSGCFAASHPAAPPQTSRRQRAPCACVGERRRGDTRVKALDAECAAAGFADT